MSLFNFQGSFALSQECSMIISHRFALVKCFFEFFLRFSFRPFSLSVPLFRSFSALSYHTTTVCVCQELFLTFFALSSEDTSLRCRSLECLHILPYHFPIVNYFFKLFRHFLQRALVLLVRYAIYDVFTQ